MTNHVFIHSDEVKVLGEEEQVAELIVDLRKVWNEILSKYTQIYAVGHIQVPILETDEAGHLIRKEMELKVSGIFNVDEVVDQQVTLKTIYSGLIQDDPTRIATGDVVLIVYSVDEVEGNVNA